MVGASILSKIIQCKRNIKNKKKNHSEKNIKKESYEPTNCLDKFCRICLNQGTIPIFGSAYRQDISEEVNSFGGIHVKIDDEHPKHLCESCHRLLQSAILFRSTAQSTERILKLPKVETDLNTYDTWNYDDGNTNFSDDTKVSVFDNNKIADGDFNLAKSETDQKQTGECDNEKRKCEVCNRSFTARYFDVHMNQHSVEKEPYMCDICGKKFDKKYQFTSHHLAHFNELPFKCPQCPYRGRYKGHLQSHMKTHSGEKPFQCEHCPSKFLYKSNLNKHMLTHKTEKDFKCDTCGKGYHTKKDLDNHFKADHAGIKEHICKLCGKEFGYRNQMMKHELRFHKRQKLQSGIRPLYLRDEFKQSVN